MQKKLKSFLSTALLVLSSYGTSCARGNNYEYYGYGRQKLHRHELSYWNYYDDDEFYYNPCLAESTNQWLYGASATPPISFVLYNLLKPSDSKTESHVDGESDQLQSENNGNVKKNQSAENDNRLKNENNANMISFADEKKNISKLCFRHEANSCYVNAFLQALFQNENLVKLIKEVNENEIDDRLKGLGQNKKNLLRSVNKLILKIENEKKLDRKDWIEILQKMGWDGNPDSPVFDLWNPLLEALECYYGYSWKFEKNDEGKDNTIFHDRSYLDLDDVKNNINNLNLNDVVKNSLRNQINSITNEITPHDIRIGFHTFLVQFPGLFGNKKKETLKELKDISNFKELNIRPNGGQKLWINYDEECGAAHAELKAFLINTGGHWICVSRHIKDNVEKWFVHDDVKLYSEGEYVKEITEDKAKILIRKHPVGAVGIYSLKSDK